MWHTKRFGADRVKDDLSKRQGPGYVDRDEDADQESEGSPEAETEAGEEAVSRASERRARRVVPKSRR